MWIHQKNQPKENASLVIFTYILDFGDVNPYEMTKQSSISGVSNISHMNSSRIVFPLYYVILSSTITEMQEVYSDIFPIHGYIHTYIHIYIYIFPLYWRIYRCKIVTVVLVDIDKWSFIYSVVTNRY